MNVTTITIPNGEHTPLVIVVQAPAPLTLTTDFVALVAREYPNAVMQS